LHGHKNRIESCNGNSRQDLRHDFFPTGSTHQTSFQALKRRRQVGKRCAITQRARLALDQRDVMLPVVTDLTMV
jgi:hypothetical protein